MILELEEIMVILIDPNITETEAIELVKKLEVVSNHIISELVNEVEGNE